MGCIKIELKTIKLDRDKRPVEKTSYFDVHAINITDWDIADKANKSTCKIFLSGAPFESFQVNMSKEALVEKLRKCGVTFIN
jgi:hypothetical protein